MKYNILKVGMKKYSDFLVKILSRFILIFHSIKNRKYIKRRVDFIKCLNKPKLITEIFLIILS